MDTDMKPPFVAANTSRPARAVEGGSAPNRAIAPRFVAALAALAALPASAAEPPLRYPPDSVLLLVAPWCAPCHAELARIDAIAAAARPRAVRVFMVEDGPRARAMWRDVPDSYRWTPPAGEERRYRGDALARTAGLPFGIATDARGRVCATRGGGMDAARVAALVEGCP
jgi:thiol-disulfide isomerase/thioredoxin